MKGHDPKFTTMNFCYDYLNTNYFSSPKQEFDIYFVQTYSDAEQTSELKPKAYVPTLVLEENILELEKLLNTAHNLRMNLLDLKNTRCLNLGSHLKKRLRSKLKEKNLLSR